MEHIKTPMPFSFDGHGINDAEGQRICKVSSCDPYIHIGVGVKRNPEFDGLSNLFAAAPEMFEALRLVLRDKESGCLRVDTCNHIETIIAKAEAQARNERL